MKKCNCDILMTVDLLGMVSSLAFIFLVITKYV